MDDRELLELMRRDPEAGAEQLLKTYSGIVASIVRGVLIPPGTMEDLEECVSDTFVLFCQNVHRVDLAKGSVKTYLAAIARNSARSCRRSLRPESLPLEDTLLGEDTMRDRVLAMDLAAALRRLPPKERSLLWSRYYLCRPVKEIAAELSITENAAELRIRRALEHLRKLMKEDQP